MTGIPWILYKINVCFFKENIVPFRFLTNASKLWHVEKSCKQKIPAKRLNLQKARYQICVAHFSNLIHHFLACKVICPKTSVGEKMKKLMKSKVTFIITHRWIGKIVVCLLMSFHLLPKKNFFLFFFAHIQHDTHRFLWAWKFSPLHEKIFPVFLSFSPKKTFLCVWRQRQVGNARASNEMNESFGSARVFVRERAEGSKQVEIIALEQCCCVDT